MLKVKKRVVLISIIAAFIVWLLDTLIDAKVLGKGPFWRLLFTDELHELIFFLSSFILFSLIISWFFMSRRELEAALTESEEKYRRLFEGAGDGIFILEAEGPNAGRIVTVNRAAAEMHGYTVDELSGMNIAGLDDPDSAKEVHGRIERILRGEWLKAEILHKKKNGVMFPVEISAGLLELEGRKYILAFDRDITNRRESEKVLRESEEKYRSLVESLGDSIYLIDRDYRYLFMNRKHIERLGIKGEGFVGVSYDGLHSPEESEAFREIVDKVFSTGQVVQHEHLSHRDNRYFLRTLSPVMGHDGKVAAVTVVSKDINVLKQMEQKLLMLSFTDELTGLHNRRGFMVLAEQQLKMASRLRQGVFLLYADLDNLKTINDNFGHAEGDQALKDISGILKKTFRESDIVARIGGDEFAVFPIIAEESNVDSIYCRLQRFLDVHNKQQAKGYNLAVSIGIEYCDPSCENKVDELIVRADRKMYEQKRQKKSIVT